MQSSNEMGTISASLCLRPRQGTFPFCMWAHFLPAATLETQSKQLNTFELKSSLNICLRCFLLTEKRRGE